MMLKHGRSAFILSVHPERLAEIQRVMIAEGWETETYLIPSEKEKAFFPKRMDGRLARKKQAMSHDIVVCDLSSTDRNSWYMPWLLACRYQTNKPVVGIRQGRSRNDFRDAFQGIGVEIVSEFFQKIAPVAGKRTLRDLWTAPIHDNDGKNIAGYFFDKPMPEFPDDDPAWTSWGGCTAYWCYWISIDDPRLDHPAPALWADLALPSDNGDLERLAAQRRKTMPKRDYYPSKRWKQEWSRRFLETVDALGMNPEQKHALYSIPGLLCASFFYAEELRHRLMHVLCRSELDAAELKAHLPMIKAVLDRMIDDDCDFAHDEHKSWVGYTKNTPIDEIISIAQKNMTWPHYQDCPWQW